MKKKLTTGFTLILYLLILTLISCAKDTPYNGNVTIAATYNGNPVPQVNVYYKQGNAPAVPLSPNQYNGELTTGSNGEVTFYELTPGSYYFYATGFSTVAGRSVQGDTTIIVPARYRAESDFTILLKLK